MEYVDALKDKNDIQAMKQILLKKSKRDYLLFVVGINTGLKISEILNIKVADFLNKDGAVKDFYENKDSFPIFLNSNIKNAFYLYIESSPIKDNDYLFKSTKTSQAITRQQAYRIIDFAAKEVGIEGNIGTHSMRKTFGYHAYKRGVAISILQKLFHHSTPAYTLKYLGIQKGDDIKTEIDVNL